MFVSILGGFNGHKMINEVLLFDLVSMRWLTYGRTDMVMLHIHSLDFSISLIRSLVQFHESDSLQTHDHFRA